MSIMPDCLKNAMTKCDKYESDINPEYAESATHSSAPRPFAVPYSANTIIQFLHDEILLEKIANSPVLILFYLQNVI